MLGRHMLNMLGLVLLVALVEVATGDMCDQLNTNPKFDRDVAVNDVYVNNGFTCKAVYITKVTAVLTNFCVEGTEDPANVYSTPEDDDSQEYPSILITPPPGGSLIHTVKFPRPNPGGGSGGGGVYTPEDYLNGPGATNNKFPRLNPGFYSDSLCLIRNNGDDIEMAETAKTDCEPAGQPLLRDDQACFIITKFIPKTDDLLGNALVHVHTDAEQTPYLTGFVTSVAPWPCVVVDLVSAVANDIGCLDSVPGFWMNFTGHYIDDPGVPDGPGCISVGWLNHSPPVCGIHPPMCLAPIIKTTTPPGDPNAVCPAGQDLTVDLMQVTCCDNDLGCDCDEYGAAAKCPW